MLRDLCMKPRIPLLTFHFPGLAVLPLNITNFVPSLAPSMTPRVYLTKNVFVQAFALSDAAPGEGGINIVEFEVSFPFSMSFIYILQRTNSKVKIQSLRHLTAQTTLTGSELLYSLCLSTHRRGKFPTRHLPPCRQHPRALRSPLHHLHYQAHPPPHHPANCRPRPQDAQQPPQPLRLLPPLQIPCPHDPGTTASSSKTAPTRTSCGMGSSAPGRRLRLSRSLSPRPHPFPSLRSRRTRTEGGSSA